MKITRLQLEDLIDDDTYFARGQSYFENGAVSLIKIVHPEKPNFSISPSLIFKSQIKNYKISH